MRPSTVNWVLFGLLGLFWGSSYLFIKIGVDAGLPPFTLIAGRLGIGAAMLGAILFFSREPLPRDPLVYRRLAIMGLINIALPFTLITWGEQSIDSSLAAIINATVPLFTIVLASLVFVDESITVSRLIGLALGFIGVIVLVSRSLFGGGTEGTLLGELALIGSSISYASGAVYARRSIHGLRPMIPAFFQVFFAFCYTFTLSLVLDHPWTLTPSPDALFAVAWLGVFGSSLAYLCFFRLLRDWGATRTSTVAYLLPVVGIVLGALVLGESLDGRIALGTGLILAGVAFVNSRRASRRIYSR